VSKSSVTKGIYEYMQPDNSNIPNLGVVYRALPKVSDESQLFSNSYPNLGLGACIYLFVTSQVERRIALGGEHSGRKFRTYDTGMLVVFKSDLPQTEDGQIEFDHFCDALTTFIEANRVPNIPWSDIFQWGEGTELGGPDIRFDYTIPRTLDGGVTIYQGVLHVQASEVLPT